MADNKKIMNQTIDYYNLNAKAFADGTKEVGMYDLQNRFLRYLKPTAYILDFGCGSGRDTKYFLNKGYTVDATDGSKEMCRIAKEYTGIDVKQMLFEELNAVDKYDGIWACASILHASKSSLPSILKKMSIALKDGGIAYTSFKYGNVEGERNGRYFSDFTETEFTAFIKSNDTDFEIIESWVTTDARPDRKSEQWLNLILKKTV